MNNISEKDIRPEFIRPYKLAGKKCEKEIDARDVIRLDSSNIRNAGKTGKIMTGGNIIKNPENIVDNPDKITEQILELQHPFVDDETSRSRRIYTTIYQIPTEHYHLSTKEGIEMAERVSKVYSEYPSVYTVSEGKKSLRIDMIFSNYSVYGEKLTKKFKPATMFNQFMWIREEENSKRNA